MSTSFCRVLPLVAALWASPTVAQSFIAYHDADGSEHDAQYQKLSSSGYRLISLSSYGGVSNTQYAAVWAQRSGPSFVGFRDLTSTEYQQLLDFSCGNMTPALLSATGSAADPRFSGVFEKTGNPCHARHGIDESELATEVGDARKKGLRIASIDAYGDASDTRYVVAFEPNAEKLGWGHYIAYGSSTHQLFFDTMGQTLARPVDIVFNDDRTRFVAVWEDTSVGLSYSHHDMTSAEYQDKFDEYLAKGHYPINVRAAGTPGVFAATWAKTDVPDGRKFSMTGVDVPELVLFDSWVQQYMTDTATRAASLAIVKDGRLMLARGYTWAEQGYPLAQPDSLYRTASISKPLTSIAVHQEMALQPSAIAYDTAMADLFGNPVYADPQSNAIQVMHLLTHTSGWDRDAQTGSGVDPMFYDRTIASALGISIPISTTAIRRYMESQMLDFAPGTESRYSNYGFSLLGRILEVLNPGKTYDDILQERVFAPLGITRAGIGAAHVTAAVPGEVLYHPAALGVAQSVNAALEPWVPSQYGGWNQGNLDAHGGHVITAPDYAKILAAFDLGAQNPILGPVQTANMWTEPAAPFIQAGPNINSAYLKGWVRNSVKGPGGTNLDLYEHAGSLPGTRTYIGRREDGVSFVFLTNGHEALNGAHGDELSSIANVIGSWPDHDLFPSVGLPALRHVPGSVNPFGASCVGSFGTPGTSYVGTPEVGMVFTPTLILARPQSPAFLLLGQRTQVPLPGGIGCFRYTTAGMILPATTSPAGTAQIALPMPATPALIGYVFAAQYAFLDSSAGSAGIVTTNGLDIKLGGWLGF